MSGTLDFLKKKQAEAREDADATTQPAAEAAQPAQPAQPAAEAPATQPVDTTPAPAAETPAPAAQAPQEAAQPVLAEQALITSDEEASAALALLTGEGASLTSVIAGATESGGAREKYPFAQIRQFNWNVFQSTPDNIKEFMPVGNRPFTAIYCGFRVGCTAWPTARNTGDSPVWAAAAPHVRINPQGQAIADRIMKVGRKIQFTKRIERDCFDTAGHLTPELHFLVWTPHTSFIVLVIPGYNSTALTNANVKKLEENLEQPLLGLPLIFSIGVEVQQRSAKTRTGDPEKDNWKDPKIDLDVAASETGEKYLLAFRDELGQQAKAENLMRFAKTLDFDGLRDGELIAKLQEYPG